MVEFSSRLLDYFVVYGLKENKPISLQQDEERWLDSLPSRSNIISQLRLLLSKKPFMLTQSDFTQYHRLCTRKNKELWLEVEFKRLNGKDNDTANGEGLSNLAIFYAHAEGNFIKIPADMNVQPIPLISSRSASQFSHTAEGYHYYTGHFDLTPYVGLPARREFKIVLTVSPYHTCSEPPLSDIKLVTGEMIQDESGNWKKRVNIPKEYHYINVPIGKERDTFICYKEAVDPMKLSFAPEMIERFPREDYEDSPLSSAITMFSFNEELKLSHEQIAPSIFSFVLTTQEGDSSRVPRIYITCLVFYELLPDKLSKKIFFRREPSVYAPKALLLVSHWPFIEHFKTILKEIYRLHLSAYSLPIERVICNLMQEVHLPENCNTAVVYTIGRTQVKFSRWPSKGLPYVPSACLEYLFRSLPVRDIISVWSVILIEKKVLLISKNKALLTYVAMALVSLIFPFKWEQVLIPLLPTPLKNYIETIFPYIIGVSPETLSPDIELPIDAIQVDLDNGQILSHEELPKLPDRRHRNLCKRLAPFDIHSISDPVRDTCDDAFNFLMNEDEERSARFDGYLVRDAFLEFMTGLLKNYSQFLEFPEKRISRACFNTQAFLSAHKATSDNSFLRKVTETSMFAHFIENGVSGEIKPEVQYFDSAMKFKRTRVEASFVKPWEPTELVHAITPNNIGFEPGMLFRYNRFPMLNEDLFEAPRVSSSPVVVTKSQSFLDENEINDMQHLEWAKFLLMSIYKIWFYVFTISIPKFRQNAEQMMDLALIVMDSMVKKGGKPDEQVFLRLIEMCGHCGLRDSVLTLFKRMKSHGIEPDSSTHGVYVKAVAERQEVEKNIERYTCLKDLQPDSICLSLELEKCIYIADNTCPGCTNILLQEEIMAGWTQTYTSNATRCPSCKARFNPKFTVFMDHVSIGDAINSLSVDLLGPHILRRDLEELVSTQGESFLIARDLCDAQKTLFWNFALYFDLMRLPSAWLSPTFEVESIPKMIETFSKPRRKRISANSFEYSADSDNDSTSSKEENKLFALVKRATSMKTNIASEKSSKHKHLNKALLKLFTPLTKQFRNDNLNKGQMALAERGIDIASEQQSDHE